MRDFSPTVLTIEDDPVVRESIVGWLEDAGFSVLQKDNGIDGLQAFRETNPAAVLLDLGIPGIEGIRLLELFTAEAPHTPVIVVSGHAEIDAAITAFKAGARDYLTKPILNMELLEQTVRNCLEVKNLKDRLMEAEHRYYALVQNLPAVVFSLTNDGHMRFLNSSSQHILGYSPDLAESTPDWFWKQIPDADRESTQRAFLRAIQHGSPASSGVADSPTAPHHPGNAEESGPANASSPPEHDATAPRNAAHTPPFSLGFFFLHADGYPVWLHATSLSISPSAPGTNAPGHMEGLLADMTEHAFLARLLIQREKLNTLGAMTDEISHELRNPVFALGGFARRLHEQHPQIPEAEIILQEARRLEQLMDRIREYLDPVAVNLGECSLNGVLRLCADVALPRLRGRGISPELHMCPDLAPIQSDTDLLSQICMTLIATASRQMPPEGALSLRTHAAPGRQYLSVSAPLRPGSTLSPDRILMPFEQDSPAPGLAVAHRLTRDLGGLLQVRQETGTLTFTLSLPA